MKNIFIGSLLLLSLLGCADTHFGKYINVNNDSEFIELSENGNFTLHESGMNVQGQYKLEGTDLTLNFKMGQREFSVHAFFEAGIIKDQEGKSWHKNNTTPPILIALIAALIAIILYIISNKIPNIYLKSMSQVGSIITGIIILVPFAESAHQARTVLGKYYFYTLIAAAILSMVYSKITKSKQAK